MDIEYFKLSLIEKDIYFSIDINKYLEGVVIYYTNNDELEKKLENLKKLLKKYNLDNINIFSHDKKIIYSS